MLPSLAELGPSFSCSMDNNCIRIRTPYLYPDGEVIDVYIKEQYGYYTVTELGKSLEWLKRLSAKDSNRQKSSLSYICLTLKVDLYKGQLVLSTDKQEQLADAIFIVGRAAASIQYALTTVSKPLTKYRHDHLRQENSKG